MLMQDLGLKVMQSEISLASQVDMSKKKRIEPRVSDSTLQQMGFFTGLSGESLRNATVYVILNGKKHRLVFADDGTATIEVADER